MMYHHHQIQAVVKTLKPLAIFPAVIGLLCTASMGIFGSCTNAQGSDSGQPIAYNHKLHIETVGLQCKECHRQVETAAAATLPTLEVCQNCHESEPISKSPEELALLKYVADGKEIPWKRIYNVPDHVYFSHRRHVAQGELDCALCHGAIQEMTTPVTSAFLELKMKNCLDCHRLHKVSNDCLSCHR